MTKKKLMSPQKSSQWIYGKHQVLAAIQTNSKKILKAYCTPTAKEFIQLFNEHHIFYKKRSVRDLTKIVGTSKHQNVIILIHHNEILSLEKFLTTSINKNKLLIVALDRINDVHNFGSILRTCEIYQVDGILFSNKEQAPLSPAVYKASSGAINYLTLVQVSDLAQALSRLKQRGFHLFGTGLSNQCIPLQNWEPFKKNVIIFGNENQGITPTILQECNKIIKIEMFGHTKSLNVSVATGILLHWAKLKISNN